MKGGILINSYELLAALDGLTRNGFCIRDVSLCGEEDENGNCPEVEAEILLRVVVSGGFDLLPEDMTNPALIGEKEKE